MEACVRKPFTTIMAAFSQRRLEPCMSDVSRRLMSYPRFGRMHRNGEDQPRPRLTERPANVAPPSRQRPARQLRPAAGKRSSRLYARSANSRLLHRNKKSYSITLSARSKNASEMFSPIPLAVARLITRSNLVGCSNGMSAGFAPRRILSTYSAARRNILV